MTTFTTQDRQDAQRTPLSEDNLELVFLQVRLPAPHDITYDDLVRFARAIERAHGIGE